MSEHEHVKIRRANETDLTAISHVLVDTWRSTFCGVVSDRFLDNMSYAQQRDRHLRYMLDQRVSYSVAECGQAGAVIGFVSGGPIRDREFPYASELYAIYIRQEFQGRGIGRRLFCTLVDQLLDDGLGSWSQPQLLRAHGRSRNNYKTDRAWRCLGGRGGCIRVERFTIYAAFILPTQVSYVGN
jgi:ribosomal protein S18 acetylase RimI-like enzyme